MPTRDNILHLESLLEATTSLIETKRVVDNVEYDIRVLKDRLGIRESQGPEGQAAAGDNMEIDRDAVGEDERSQSVLSTKSSRGRKHVRLSNQICLLEN